MAEGDVGAIAFPVAHVGGPVALLMSLETGTPHVLVERFEARRAVRAFERGGVTLLGAGPGFQPTYLALLEESGAEQLFPSLRAFLSGGAPKIPAVHEALRSRAGVEILSSYGMTEFPTATGHTVDDPAEKLLRTEGRPNPGVEVQIRGAAGRAGDVGEEGEEGEEGEIWLRGPQQCRGYLDPATTAAAFDDDSFFRTGDLGHLDAEGYLWVTGRLKDVIIRKGENISIAELEELIGRDPTVREVAVVGIPDAEVGERCCAVVVPVAGAVLDLASLTERLLAAGLMRQKLPERLEIAESLPRNANGKVVRRALQEALSRGSG
jgi:acyl-CoA synthetase (AMP-forming)/AMP-acid ligase II